MIDEIVKHVTHTINQTLLTSNISNATTNKASNIPMTIHQTYNQPKTWTCTLTITLPLTMFEQTKQIIMDRDTLSHSTTLCNKIIQSLNYVFHSKVCASMTIYIRHIFEYSNKPVNCSSILIFLKLCVCYTKTPNTHQWYRINTNEITDNHNTTICNDTTINMVSLPSAKPSESNAFETIMRLSLSQNQRDLPNYIQTQAISNTSILTNNNICNTPQNTMIQSHDQSTTFLQQFSMTSEELKKFDK